MKQLIVKIMALMVLIGMTSIHAAENNNPEGLWKTIDDVTGQAKSIVEIYPSAQHGLAGKVVKLFPNALKICSDCPGAQHNQPILGMVVMKNLKPTADVNNEWSEGSITDPKNGKTYHCKIQLSENGQRLTVRGYIGIPLFGRSQTWERVH